MRWYWSTQKGQYINAICSTLAISPPNLLKLLNSVPTTVVDKTLRCDSTPLSRTKRHKHFDPGHKALGDSAVRGDEKWCASGNRLTSQEPSSVVNRMKSNLFASGSPKKRKLSSSYEKAPNWMNALLTNLQWDVSIVLQRWHLDWLSPPKRCIHYPTPLRVSHSIQIATTPRNARKIPRSETHRTSEKKV